MSTGNIGLASLAAQAANTVVANVTGSSASPTAFSMPTCSTSSSILQYTSGTGFTCSTSIWASPPAIGGTAANAGSFTTLSASSTVGGTGFSTYLASPPAIGATTPSSGKFTTLQATSTITPSSTAGIVGTTTNDNANTGSVGEYVTSTTATVSISNATYSDITTVSLTAGDWDVTGVVSFNPAGSTVVQAMIAGVSTTANTAPGFPNQTQLNGFNLTAGSQNFVNAPIVRISLASTTIVRLGAQANFTTSTCTASGFIRARRVR